jgi:hypothetical protein
LGQLGGERQNGNAVSVHGACAPSPSASPSQPFRATRPPLTPT